MLIGVEILSQQNSVASVDAPETWQGSKGESNSRQEGRNSHFVEAASAFSPNPLNLARSEAPQLRCPSLLCPAIRPF